MRVSKKKKGDERDDEAADKGKKVCQQYLRAERKGLLKTSQWVKPGSVLFIGKIIAETDDNKRNGEKKDRRQLAALRRKRIRRDSPTRERSAR